MQIEALVLRCKAPAPFALVGVVGAVVLVGRELRERPALHGDCRAGLEGSGLGWLARAVLHRPVVGVAVAGKPPRDTPVDIARDRLQLRGVGLGGWMEEDAPLRIVRED